MKKRIGIYAGTFDPITKGHLDIISRGRDLFDEFYVAVASNASKTPLFSAEERLKMVQDDVKSLPRHDCPVIVESISGLLVHYALAKAQDRHKVSLVRAMRTGTDFDYEFQMAGMNTDLAPTIETVFLMAAKDVQFISSSIIKDIAKNRGDVSRFVTPQVLKNLSEKLGLKP